MDDHIIDRVNTLVKPNDVLYNLGDFCYWKGASPTIARDYRSRIICNNVHLILGNHDYKYRNNFIQSRVFSSVSDILQIRGDDGDSKRDIVLCHYAMRVWNRSHHGVAHAYGHSHGTLPDDPNSRSMDVGIDCIPDYSPISFDEFWERMNKKTFKPINHHGDESCQ